VLQQEKARGTASSSVGLLDVLSYTTAVASVARLVSAAPPPFRDDDWREMRAKADIAATKQRIEIIDESNVAVRMLRTQVDRGKCWIWEAA
jgi:hypothetical protein